MIKFAHRSCPQSGNVLTAILGVVAIISVLSISLYGLVNGPVRSAVVVTKKSQAQSDLILAGQLILKAAEDSNADGVPEVPEFDVTITPRIQNTSNADSGGGIPATIGASKLDPWGVPYAYCAWDHGTAVGGNRLLGTATDYQDRLFIALVSAGPNRVFDTQCDPDATYLTEDVDGLPETDDDIIERYSFAQAAAAGFWQDIGGADTGKIMTSASQVLVGNIADPDIDPTVQLQVSEDMVVGGGLQSNRDTGTATALLGGGSVTNSVTFNPATGNINLAAGTMGATTSLTTDTLTGITDAGIVNNLNAHYWRLDPAGAAVDYALADLVNLSTAPFTGTLDPAQLPAFTGDIEFSRTDADTVDTNVAYLRGKAVQDVAPDPGDILVWDQADSRWEPGLPALAGDVTGAVDANTVVALRENPVNAGAPGANMVLGWNGSAWAPMLLEIGPGDATTIGFTGINFLAESANITNVACTTGEIPKYYQPTGEWNCRRDVGTAYSLPMDVDSAANAIMGTRNTGADVMISFRTGAAAPAVSNTIFGKAGAGINWGTAGGGNVLIGEDVVKTASGSIAQVTAVGLSALAEVSVGQRITAIGGAAGAFNGNNDNTFVGEGAGYVSGGESRMVAIGAGACSGNSTFGAGGDTVAIGGDFTATKCGDGDPGQSVYLGTRAGLGVRGPYNVLIGFETGSYLDQSQDNVMIGNKILDLGDTYYNADASTCRDGNWWNPNGHAAADGDYNVFIGNDIRSSDSATCMTTANANVALGINLLENMTTGNENVVIGNNIMNNIASPSRVVAIGSQALLNTTTVTESVVIGYQAATKSGTMSYSTIVGNSSGGSVGGGVLNASHNTIVAGSTSITSGSYNTIFGSGAGYFISTGNRNIAIGDTACASIRGGDDNICLGERTGSDEGNFFTPIIYDFDGLYCPQDGLGGPGCEIDDDVRGGDGNILIGRGFTVDPGQTDYLYIGTHRVGYLLYGPMSSGTLTLKGTLTAPSDKRLKHSIKPLLNARERLQNLHGVFYKWKKWYSQDSRERVGFVAQQVQKYMPEVIFQNEKGGKKHKYLAVAYEQIVPVLIEDMKERQKRIDALKLKIEELKKSKK